MIKKLAALLAAAIFFLSAPVAQAEEPSATDLVDKPFAEEKNPPEEKWTPPVYKPTPPAEEETPSVDKPFADEKNPPEEKWTPPVDKPQPPEEEVEGLEFLVYHQDGVMAFAVIADHEKYFVRPVLARGQVLGRATVSQMNAPDAIATINASYFAPNGVILGNTKIDGVTAGTTYFIRSAVGIRADGSTIFARQTYRGVLQFNGEEVVVGGVNCERNANSVVVYNGWYGATTGTNNFGVEFVVQGGVVVNIFRERGNNYIPPDGFVVSAHGTAAESFKGVYVGDEMIFDEDFINVEHGEDFNEALHVIGAGPTLVKDGEIYVTADAEQFPPDIRVGRAPRSAFGITQYGDYIFAVVDGRQTHSKGCTLTEWARILKNNFGAVEAINLDGGGSTELFFKGKLVNRPSDGKERPVGDVLTIIRK